MGEFINSIKLSFRDNDVPVIRLDIFRALKAFFDPGDLLQLVRIGRTGSNWEWYVQFEDKEF
jgi:hypothetical protein